MRLILLSFISLTLLQVSSLAAGAEKLILEGNYRDKNLYVTNCYGEGGVGFAVSAVRVNGQITTDEVQSSAFEIDFSALGIKNGDAVVVQIEYSGPCMPKVLNPDAILPVPTFEVTDIKVDESGMITWSTIKENGSLPYSIEQYKWNKWVKVGEVDGVGTPESHTYKFKANLVSGENKFRVTQKVYNSTLREGESASVRSSVEKPDFKYNKGGQKVEFSAPTSFEVYDMYGQIRKRGYGAEIDMSRMEKGIYYVNFDNVMEKIKK